MVVGVVPVVVVTDDPEANEWFRLSLLARFRMSWSRLFQSLFDGCCSVVVVSRFWLQFGLCLLCCRNSCSGCVGGEVVVTVVSGCVDRFVD